MDLTEKQRHFEYRSPDDLYPHPAPHDCNLREWNRILGEIGGRDDFGDNRLQLVWGGTAQKRGYEQKPNGVSVPCWNIKYPGPVPKSRKLKGFEYVSDRDNKSCFVPRADLAPKGAFVYPVYEYLQLGMLRWVLERKFTPVELVALQMHPDPNTEAGKFYGVEQIPVTIYLPSGAPHTTIKYGTRRFVAPMNPRGEYVALYPLQTPDGLYFEPTGEWFDFLRKAEHEARNATPEDKARFFRERLEYEEAVEVKNAEYEHEQDEILKDEIIVEAESEPQGRVIFS